MPISTSTRHLPRRVYRRAGSRRPDDLRRPPAALPRGPVGTSRRSTSAVETRARKPVRMRAVAPQTVSSSSSKKCIARGCPEHVPALLVVHAVGEQLGERDVEHPVDLAGVGGPASGRPSMMPDERRDHELADRRSAGGRARRRRRPTRAASPISSSASRSAASARGRRRRAVSTLPPGNAISPWCDGMVLGHGLRAGRPCPTDLAAASVEQRQEHRGVARAGVERLALAERVRRDRPGRWQVGDAVADLRDGERRSAALSRGPGRRRAGDEARGPRDALAPTPGPRGLTIPCCGTGYFFLPLRPWRARRGSRARGGPRRRR